MDVPVEAEVKLGTKQMDTRDVLEMKEGDVMTLEQDTVSPLTVKVEGLPKF